MDKRIILPLKLTWKSEVEIWSDDLGHILHYPDVRGAGYDLWCQRHQGLPSFSAYHQHWLHEQSEGESQISSRTWNIYGKVALQCNVINMNTPERLGKPHCTYPLVSAVSVTPSRFTNFLFLLLITIFKMLRSTMPCRPDGDEAVFLACLYNLSL